MISLARVGAGLVPALYRKLSDQNPNLQKTTMKRIFILILTILVEGFTISFAQGPANYQVKGQIKDARTGETMPLVNVALLRPSDSVFMRGATSDMTGSYAIRDVAAGQYLLRATSVGFLPGRWITSSSTIPALCSSCRFPARSLQDLSR